jgi:hypothetical protein
MAAIDRLYSWVALAALSVVILSALVDQLPASTRNGKENYVIATASISLIFGTLFVVANVVDSLRNLIVGNIIENGEYRDWYNSLSCLSLLDIVPVRRH